MARILADLTNWTSDEQCMWVLMASTGARSSEVYQIDGEEYIDGHRVIALGKAGGRMPRRIVLPTCAGPFVPTIIDGPLFSRSCEYLEKTVRARLVKLGYGEGKGLPSLHLRAQARLETDETIPLIVIDSILGRASLFALADPPSFVAIAKAINVIGFGGTPS